MGKKIQRILGMTLIIGLLFTATVWAAGGNSVSAPGSIDDPVVTKSYVDERIQPISEGLAQMAKDMEQLTKQMESFTKNQGGKPSNQEGDQPPINGPRDSSLAVEQLDIGQSIIGFEGTEFIVRSGKVLAVEGDKGDGLPDVTEGNDIKGGEVVPLNHLVLIPRTDHRGLKVAMDSPKASWIIIRGPYQIVE